MKNKSDKFESMLEETFFEKESLSEDLVNKTRIKLHNKENETMKSNHHSPLKWVAAIIIGLLLTGITAFASWQLLTPSKLVNEFDDLEKLAMAFESEDAIYINETIISDGYIFTLISIVTGEYLTDFSVYINDVAVQNDRTYAVLTIKQEDGTPMNESTSSFFSSPYVHGVHPFHLNIHILGGGHQEVIIDGILYRVIDMYNIEIFANHGVYIGINSGNLFSHSAFNFDETTGVISVNPDFNGSSVLFRLPLDPALADDVRAQAVFDDVIPITTGDEEIEDDEELANSSFELDCHVEFEYLKNLTHEQLDEVIITALELGDYYHCIFELMFVHHFVHEHKDDINYARLNDEELADFLQVRIDRDIEAGLYPNIIEGGRRDRENMLRRMRTYDIPYFVIFYCNEGSILIIEGHPFDWLLDDN